MRDLAPLKTWPPFLSTYPWGGLRPGWCPGAPRWPEWNSQAAAEFPWTWGPWLFLSLGLLTCLGPGAAESHSAQGLPGASQMLPRGCQQL